MSMRFLVTLFMVLLHAVAFSESNETILRTQHADSESFWKGRHAESLASPKSEASEAAQALTSQTETFTKDCQGKSLSKACQNSHMLLVAIERTLLLKLLGATTLIEAYNAARELCSDRSKSLVMCYRAIESAEKESQTDLLNLFLNPTKRGRANANAPLPGRARSGAAAAPTPPKK